MPHFSVSGFASPNLEAAILPAKKSAFALSGTGIFLWLRTCTKYSCTLFSINHFLAPSVSLNVSRSSDLSSNPSMIRSAESESLSKIMEQFETFSF